MYPTWRNENLELKQRNIHLIPGFLRICKLFCCQNEICFYYRGQISEANDFKEIGCLLRSTELQLSGFLQLQSKCMRGSSILHTLFPQSRDSSLPFSVLMWRLNTFLLPEVWWQQLSHSFCNSSQK